MDSIVTSEKGPARAYSQNVDNVSAEGFNIIDFEENDPENPINWPSWKKWTIIVSVALMRLASVLATAAIIPAAPQALADLHTTSSLYRTLLVSIWELGEGIGPFYIAPLSEKYGRMWVFHIGNLAAVVFCVVSALSVNVQMLVAFRFFSGSVMTAITLGPSISGDMFVAEQRGGAMAVAISTSVLGTFIAPICGSFIAQGLGWRWTLWLNAATMGAFSLLYLVFVRETYAVVLHERKAKRARKETGNLRIQSKYQVNVDATTVIDLATRPMRTLLLSPTILLITLYTAITYAMSYLILTTLTTIMEDQYSFTQGPVGLTFLGLSIGNLVGMFFYAFTSDRYMIRKKNCRAGNYRVEHRLLHLVFGAVILPFGLLLYGWTLQYRVHFIVPLVATGLIGFCVVIAILPTENYLVDAYPTQNASAIAAGVILRAVSGAVFPLCGPPLYQHLHYGWGNSVLALIAALFVLPLALLFRYGEKLRVKENLVNLQ